MQDRVLTSFEDFESIDGEIDYNSVDSVLDRERGETYSWLSDAISGC